MKKTFLFFAACAGSFLLGAFINGDDLKKPLTADMVAVAARVFGL